MGKSDVAKKVASDLGWRYIDVRALLLDPVDLRGIPWRDGNRTRWAPPSFLPEDGETNGDGGPVSYIINLEELPNAPPMVQSALYQLVLDRAVGEYRLPDTASIIACGNREQDRSGVNRMAPPLASRFVHVDLTVSNDDWQGWAAAAGIEPEVMAFVYLRPELLHGFDPGDRREKAFPCPRTWAFASDALAGFKASAENGDPVDPAVELAVYRGTVGEAAAVEFYGFLRVFRKMPHPRTVLADPEGAPIPDSHDALIALCGSLWRLADEDTFDALVTYAMRLRPEVAEYTVGQCIRGKPDLQYTRAYAHRWLPHSSSI